MAVNISNEQYNLGLVKWSRCRDVIGGTDTVKAARERYLPKLESMSKAMYNAYLKRALFDNMSARLLSGFSGVITRRPPEAEYPAGMEPYFKDTTMTGKSFIELFKWVTDELLTTGRVPLLVDKGSEGGRAYVVPYESEALINWAQNGNDPMNMGVLQETNISQKGDAFTLEYTSQFRALLMTEEGYRVDLYSLPAGTIQSISINANEKLFVSGGSGTTASLIKSYAPTIQGAPLDVIPLTVITPTGIDLNIVKPPIIDIVDINLSHYRSSADLEQGRHWVSLPVPVVSGVDGDTVLVVGAEKAWILPDKDAKAYYLEFLGQGLGSLEEALKEKQQQMVQFSSRLMDTSTRGSEAADAVKLRNMSDSATMTSMAHSIEAGLNRVYKTIAVWEGFNPDEVNITLAKDFVNTTLSAAELKVLTESFLDETIDEETFIFNLKRGDLMPPGKETLDSKPNRGTE